MHYKELAILLVVNTVYGFFASFVSLRLRVMNCGIRLLAEAANAALSDRSGRPAEHGASPL